MVVGSVCLVANYGGATTAGRKLGHRQWQAAAATSFMAASRECEGEWDMGSSASASPSDPGHSTRGREEGARGRENGRAATMEETHDAWPPRPSLRGQLSSSWRTQIRASWVSILG
jgi:hypothetical protein